MPAANMHFRPRSWQSPIRPAARSHLSRNQNPRREANAAFAVINAALCPEVGIIKTNLICCCQAQRRQPVMLAREVWFSQKKQPDSSELFKTTCLDKVSKPGHQIWL